MTALWRDWVMMNRLHCTRSQLREDAYEDLLIFAAFSAGEEEARKAQQEERRRGR